MTEEFDKFRDLVRGDVALQEELLAVTERELFISRVTALGQSHGFTFTAGDVNSALENKSELPPSRPPYDPGNFGGWVPFRIVGSSPELFVEWCHIGAERFKLPFFEDTLRQFQNRPFNILFRHVTPIDSLLTLNSAEPGLAPTGFIFHMSRCGSTLVSQMLAASSRNIVVSEASPIDSVVRAAAPDRAVQLDWLRAVIGVLGRRRFADESRYFIKFDSWNVLDLAMIREAFPEVPWVFLYRNPIEVLVSHMRQRGWQMVPGNIPLILPDVGWEEAIRMPPEEYCARILARICDAALEHVRDEKGLFVNYNELPGAVTGVIMEHFNAPHSAEEISQMENLTQFNAKTPQLFFSPDSAEKRIEATSAVREASTRWIEPLYDRLERLRTEIR